MKADRAAQAMCPTAPGAGLATLTKLLWINSLEANMCPAFMWELGPFLWCITLDFCPYYCSHLHFLRKLLFLSSSLICSRRKIFWEKSLPPDFGNMREAGRFPGLDILIPKSDQWQQRAPGATLPELLAFFSPVPSFLTSWAANTKCWARLLPFCSSGKLGRRKSFNRCSLHPWVCAGCAWGQRPGLSSDMALAPAPVTSAQCESACTVYNYPSLHCPSPLLAPAPSHQECCATGLHQSLFLLLWLIPNIPENFLCAKLEADGEDGKQHRDNSRAMERKVCVLIHCASLQKRMMKSHRYRCIWGSDVLLLRSVFPLNFWPVQCA